MMKLPASVSIGTAANWLRSKFNHDYSAITAALLYRATIRSSLFDGKQHFFLNHELFFVQNPNAMVSWQKFIGENHTTSVLHLTTPSGNQVAGDPITAITLNGTDISIGSLYSFHRGVINYEIDYPINLNRQFTMPAQPSLGMQIRLTFLDKVTGELGIVARDPRYLIPDRLFAL